MAFHAVPFVIRGENPLRGLDVDIIKNFAKKHKLEVEYVVTNRTLQEIFDNEDMAKNLLQTIQDSKIDIFIGGLDENLITRKQLAATRFYYHDKLTWCVQKSKPIPSWKNFFYGCNDPLVYIIMTSLAITTLILAYIGEQLEPPNHQKWDWHKFWSNALRCYYGYACDYNPRNDISRIGYTFLLLGSIIFVTTFSSGVVQTFIICIFNLQVRTIPEIINGKYYLIGNKIALREIMRQNEVYPPQLITKFEIVDDPSDYFDQLEWNDKLAVAASYEESRSKTKDVPFEFQKEIYCFENENIIYDRSLKILVRRDFSLLKDLNNFIRHANEGGLIDKWLKSYRSMRVQKNRFEYTDFKLESIYFLLSVCVASEILAFMVLIIEKTTFRKVQALNAKWLWRFVEIMLDPYRHFYLRNADWSRHTLTEIFLSPHGK